MAEAVDETSDTAATEATEADASEGEALAIIMRGSVRMK